MADTEEKPADEPETKDPVKEEDGKKDEATNGEDKEEEAAKEEVKEEGVDEKQDEKLSKDEANKEDDKPDVGDKPDENKDNEAEDKDEKEEEKEEKTEEAEKHGDKNEGDKPAEKSEEDEEEKTDEKSDEKSDKMDVDEDEGKGKKRKSKDDETTDDGKRRRKSAAAYVPEDFSERKSNTRLFQGRGDKLKEISGSRDSILSYMTTSREVESAYRFLFFTRGRIPVAKAKDHLLEFSGYLPAIKDGEDKAKREKEDEEIEKKFSQRAYKMSLPQVKTLCDFFDVDRTPGPDEKVNKDLLIDRLLDFLSGPNESLTKGSKPKVNSRGTPKLSSKASPKKAASTPERAPKKRGPKKKKSYKEESESEASEPEASAGSENESEGDPGKTPDDEELRMWVKAYVACHNMNKVTLNHALKLAKDKFGVSMKSKKKTMKQFLTEEC